MFSNYLSGIEGVQVYPIFSLLVFFVFFIVVTYKVFKADKNYLKKMENMPLDKTEDIIANDFEINQKA